MEDDGASAGGRREKNGWNGEVKMREGTRVLLREGGHYCRISLAALLGDLLIPTYVLFQTSASGHPLTKYKLCRWQTHQQAKERGRQRLQNFGGKPWVAQRITRSGRKRRVSMWEKAYPCTHEIGTARVAVGIG